MMLYIHIPFCESKCPYCAFNSFAGGTSQMAAYRDGLLKQLDGDLRRFGVEEISSLYIGGGTPSIFEAELLRPVLARIAPLLAPGAEASIEANPSSFSPRWGEALLAMGLNRLSLGVQSFQDAKLKLLGRRHSGQEASRTLKEARRAGFDNISIDLIFGLKGDTLPSLKSDLYCSLEADHISAYMLSLEPGTPFGARTDLALEDEALFRGFCAAIEEAGYPRYEVAAFGRRSAHNTGYWTGSDYLGIGAGAVGCVHRQRYTPPRKLAAYLAHPLLYQEESIDDRSWQMERVMLGLRCDRGIAPEWLDGDQLKRAKTLIESGKLAAKGGRLYNPDYLIADAIALYLLEGI
jgi:oxygen-independent coproporphyrinogen-3 oxidase